MKPSDKNAILDLALRRISEKDFAGRFLVPFESYKVFINGTLASSLDTKDPDDVEYSLQLLFIFKLYDSSLDSVITRLLLEKWHFKHEDLVGLVQTYCIKGTEESLFQLAGIQFAYLDYDENFGLARKCTWALATLNSPEAAEKLQQLADGSNEIIRAYARKRLPD